MPDRITQAELREFVRLTLQIEVDMNRWETTRSGIGKRLMAGADIEPGQITLEMLAIEAGQTGKPA